MSFLRGLLFDNLGLKLAALLLALLVYLNVYLDRPAEATLSFPLQVADLGDSLSLSGPVPSAVQAQVRGTGKQLLRMRVTEPPYKVPLEGIGPGRVSREVLAEDLPLAGYEGVEVSRIIGPSTIDLRIELRVSRRVPAVARIEGVAAGDTAHPRAVTVEPESVRVTGPRSVIAALDSVLLQPVRPGLRRDALRARVTPQALPDWCVMEPAFVQVTVAPVRRAP
jgi:YbbR domain-containing protein